MDKILVIATGGTIGAVSGSSIQLGNPLKIIEMVDYKDVVMDSAAPFEIFSENTDVDFWMKLVRYIASVEFAEYSGVILLHGSDTLAWTGAVLANMFPNTRLVLVAADKPLDDPRSNGVKNFDAAVEYIVNSDNDGVMVSYDGIYCAGNITSADCNDVFRHIDVPFCPVESPVFSKKAIKVICPYPGIDYDKINIDNVDTVLHTMYHSATAPGKVRSLIARCKNMNIPFYFVTHKKSADYETSEDFEHIIFESTVENAYASILCGKKHLDK